MKYYIKTETKICVYRDNTETESINIIKSEKLSRDSVICKINKSRKKSDEPLIELTLINFHIMNDRYNIVSEEMIHFFNSHYIRGLINLARYLITKDFSEIDINNILNLYVNKYENAPMSYNPQLHRDFLKRKNDKSYRLDIPQYGKKSHSIFFDENVILNH